MPMLKGMFLREKPFQLTNLAKVSIKNAFEEIRQSYKSWMGHMLKVSVA